MELKNINALKLARPSYKPSRNTGSVTSQGDLAMRANTARTTYNVSGAGVKVGVLSDSYNALNGAAAGVASGDLPAGVQVLTDYLSPDATDEGRAMAEIVHDVAPGSAIAFSTAFVGGEAGFAQNIRGLATAGCKIITDDVSYFAEPFFQDGLVAQAIDDVVTNNNVAYFTAAGNSGRSSYQSPYSSVSFSDPAYAAGTFSAHDFGGGDKRQSITIPAGGQIIISFQWDDPFFTVSGGAGAQTDMDLLVYFNNVYQPSLSSVGNNIGDDPVEIIGLSNGGGAAATIELVLVKRAGPDPTLVKWVNFGSTVPIEYDTRSSTAVGHGNTRLGASVGAAAWYSTPAFNAGLTTAIIEPFSSAGGTPVLFNTAGQRIATVVRQKPDITAADGGNTTFFYADSPSDADAFPNFFGTSAAAPHAAAVAALMQEKSGNTLSPATILSILKQTALDMDDPLTPTFDTGFDFRTGSGFVQADAAVQAVGGTTNTPPTVANVIGPRSATVGQAFTYTIPANTFTDAQTPNSLTISVSGLPPNLTFSGGTISGTPSVSGVSTITVTATDPGSLSVSTTFMLTVYPAETVTSPFSITGVTTISCTTLNVSQVAVTFTPLYAGLTGQPISFSVVSFLQPTTAPGPYTVSFVFKSPSVTLRARQTGTPGEASFTYNWQAACNALRARLAAASPEEGPAQLKVLLYPNPVGDEFAIRIQGAQGQPVKIALTDVSGYAISTTAVEVKTSDHKEQLRFGQQRAGLYLLRVSTPEQAVILKVIKQ